MRRSAATQPLGAAAFEKAQIRSVIDTAGKVGVFVVDAHPERVRREVRQGLAPGTDDNKRRFRAFPSTAPDARDDQGERRICPPFAAGLRRGTLSPKSAEKPWLTKLTLALWDWPSWAQTWRETRRSKGFGVAVFNRNHERTDALIAEHGKEGRFFPAKELPEFIASITKPRPILIMVKAGKPVDEVIDELLPHLEEGDIIIDGGNSLFTDTARRYKTCEEKKIRFVGMGVSGGEEGALEGPSMMPGGDREAWDRVAPMLTKMAAQVDGTPCCTYIGPQGAGHYVKMVHNGIEYADMQLIAEAYDLMKSVYGLDAPAMADIFQTWKEGDLDSYLIEITAAVLRKTDASTGKPLVDVIVDEAEQKGTGRWTAQNALELGVPLTAITEAVFARVLSANRAMRLELDKKIPHPARSGAQARKGGDRRHPRRALRLEDRRLCARVRADVDRFRPVQI